MAEDRYDFAIVGSSPLCSLLAGLLATRFNRSVALVAEPASPFRLLRGYDLSVAPLTRPETWSLLRHATPEVAKLLAGLGKGLVRRVDARFVAHTDAGSEALAHIRHIAVGYGHSVQREAVPKGAVHVFRDALLIDRHRTDEALAAWLIRTGIPRLRPEDITLTLRRDGSSRIEARGVAIEAGHTILGDDAAIIACLGEDLGRALRVVPATSLLTEPTLPLAAPFVVEVETGAVLIQHRTGAISALGTGAGAHGDFGAELSGTAGPRRAGQVRFSAIATGDGAPLVGLARPVRATLLAGLDGIGAFLAPAIARLIAGAASDDEVRYFAAREPGKARIGVADYAPVPVDA